MASKQALTNLKPYLKALDDGRLQDIDLQDFERQFPECAAEAGDHLQFKLHKCCQQDVKNEKEVLAIIILSKLCYSDKSISGFTNMSRFLGCVYHISTFLLKQKKYKDALEIYESLRKKPDLIKESVSKSDSNNKIIINLHIQFINSAIELSAKEINPASHDLALASISVLRFMSGKSPPPTKLIRNMKIYFNSVKHFLDENIRTIYESYMECLEYFQPDFKRTEFLCFYIFEMDCGESSTEQKQIFEYFQRRIRLFLVFLKETRLMEQWTSILNFFISDVKSTNADQALRAFDKIKKDGSELNLLVMSIVFNYSLQLWWKLHSNDWGVRVSVELVKSLFHKFLNPLRHSLRDLSKYCSSSIPYMGTCLSDLLISNLHKIFYTIRLCLKNNVSNSLDLIKVLRKSFGMMSQSLKEMTKNECCLSRRQYSWSQGIIHYTNAIEDIHRESIKSGSWEYLRDCSKELVSEIMNTNFEIPYPWKRVVLLFQRWHHASMKLQDYKEALFVCAVYLNAYPKDAEEALALWLQTKMQMSDEEVEDITIVEILEKDSDRIQELNSKYKKLADGDLKKLLLMELKAYNSCSFSNFKKVSVLYDSANRIWSQLQQLKPEIHEKALALNCVVDLTINSGDSSLIKKYEEECKRTIEKITKKGKTRPKNLFYAGNLKFSVFQLNLKSMQESEDSLNSTGVILDYLTSQEEEKAKFGDDIDLNLTCDILPSSNNLNVKLDEKYLSALNEIVQIWQEAVKNVARESLDPEEIKSWLYNVKQVAFMYQLIGDYYQGFVTWILYYRIGKIFEDSTAQLLGISYVLEECTHVDKCDLLEEAESAAEEMATDEKNRHVVVRFWLTMASKHLKQRNDSECFRYLSKVKIVLESLKEIFNYYIYNGKFWCLACHFLCVYPSYMEKFQLAFDADIRAIIYKAFSFVHTGIKAEATKSFSQTEFTELMLTFMEINMWAVEYFGVYQQTNFMRLFLEDLYKIAQKLVLPTRTAEILVKLAEIDILCEKFDDCQIKLNKLKSILMIGSIQYVEPEKTDKEYLRVPQTHLDEPISPRALSPVRFVDKDTKYRKERDVSPYACEIRRNETKFESLNHPENCRCILCRNILIQLLVIDTLALDGRCLAKRSQLKKAYNCYRGACDSLEILKSNRSEQNSKLTREMDCMKRFTGDLGFKMDLTRFHAAKFSINYAFFKLSSDAEIWSLVEKIDKILQGLTFEEKLLKWSFLELKLTAVALAKRKKKMASPLTNPRPALSGSISTPVVPRIPRKNLEPNKYEKTRSAKTPVDKKTKGRKLLDESEEEEEAAAKKPEENVSVENEDKKTTGRKLLDEEEEEEEEAAAAAKKPEKNVSVDLFESFEEKLKLTEKPKKKPLLKQKSVEIIEVRRSSRKKK